MSEPKSDLIDELTHGHQASQILLTANRLGVFAALAHDEKSHQQLASELHASPRGVRIVCDALVDLGVLHRTDVGYLNGDEVKKHLLPDSPHPRADLLCHAARSYERWGHLYDAVTQGTPVDDRLLDPRLVGNEQQFARAMADVGHRSAKACVELIDLANTRRLLDIGGGPGIYAIEFAKRWPDLEVTLFDHPPALEIAQENIESAGFSQRIRSLAGDAFADDLGGPYDTIFISNLIHIYSASENLELVKRCAECLEPEGRLILKDFFLDPDRKTPRGGAVFAVQMLVSTENGDCYTVQQAKSWFASAGLRLLEILDVASKSRLLVSQKI